MATEKSFTWTPETPGGFMNTELDELWAAINGVDLSGYVTIATTQTITGAKTFDNTVGLTVTEGVGSDTYLTLTNDSQSGGWTSYRFQVASDGDLVFQYFDSTWKNIMEFDAALQLIVNHDLYPTKKIAEFTSANPKRDSTAATGTITPTEASGSFLEIGTLTGNITIANQSGFNNDSSFVLWITPHASTDYTISWGTDYIFAGGTAPSDVLGGDGPTVCSCQILNGTTCACSCGENYS